MFHFQLLIGYNKGLVVLWDTENAAILQTFIENFRVQNLCWCQPRSLENSTQISNLKFLTAHNDGSYVVHTLLKNLTTTTVGRHGGELGNNSFSAATRMEYKPFGPFPLKPVEKVVHSYFKWEIYTYLKCAPNWSLPEPVLHHLFRNGDEMVVFSGGMPRSSFSDKFVLTVERNPEEPSRTKRVCFDFTSKIVDFALLEDKSCVEGNVETRG